MRIFDAMRSHKPIVLIFAVAVVVRAALLFWIYTQHNQNLLSAIIASDGYYEISQNLIAGNGFSRSLHLPIIPDSIRTPLYPLFIAGFVSVFKSYWAVIFAQIIIGSFIPILGWRLILRMTGEQTIATFVGVALAVEPFGVWLSTALLTETLFTALFLCFSIYYVRYMKQFDYGSLIIAGIFLGLATLTKPTTQYLPLLLFVHAVWYFRKHLRAALVGHFAMFFLVFFLILSPWLYRNYKTFNAFRLSVQPVANLYLYLVPSAIALESRIGFEDARNAFFSAEGIADTDAVHLGNDSFFKTRALNVLKDYPLGLIKSIGVSLATFFTHDGYFTVIQRLGYLQEMVWRVPALSLALSHPLEAVRTLQGVLFGPGVLVVVGRVMWLAIAVASAFGFYTFVRLRRRALPGITFFIALIVLYFACTTTINGLAVNARFRFPVNPLVYFLTLYGVFHLVRYDVDQRT